MKNKKGEKMPSKSKNRIREKNGNEFIRGYNLIGGKWSSTGTVFESRNPANTDELIGIFPDTPPNLVNLAADYAKKAYPSWKKVPAPKRAEILFKAAEILRLRKEELATLMTREMGKNLAESRGDVQEAIDMCEFIAGEGRRLYGVTTTSELPNKFSMSRRMPIGVCGLITPWNFPIAIPSWKIAPALICGNTIVFKPAEDTPACAEAFVKILLEAGLENYPGVLNLVHGSGEVAGSALVRNLDVRLISFTGSSETGRIVAQKCAETHKRKSLEMGGKNCTIIADDADLNLAVESCWWGAFGTAGQRCTASSRLIVAEKILDGFLEAFVERTMRTNVGGGLDPKTDMGPLINKDALEKTAYYVNIAKTNGAKILCGGNRIGGDYFEKGYFFEPTVLLDKNPFSRINQEEVFGPVTSIIPAKTFQDAIEYANCVNYGLSTAIITENVRLAFSAIEKLESGITYVNSSTIGAEVHLPFGGVKNTGDGHREGLGALDIFSEWKTVYLDYSGKLQKAQIDN